MFQRERGVTTVSENFVATKEWLADLPYEVATGDGMTNCHINSIIGLMKVRETQPNTRIIQCLWKNRKHNKLGFHSHSFLINLDDNYTVDLSVFPSIRYGSLEEYNDIAFIRRSRIFTPDQILYWVRKTGVFSSYDKFVTEVDAYCWENRGDLKYDYLIDESDPVIEGLLNK